MQLHDLKPVEGARHKKKRVGRGTGSGHGKTSGRGHDGQNQRSGGGVRPLFEGGQTPLFKRLPKRGFTNINRVEFGCVNVGELHIFEEGTIVNKELLYEAGLVNKKYKNVKVLGKGNVDKKLTVIADKFSKSAEQAIVNAGGKIEVI
ncbi:MAG: 50S ribosomal protein L15 [Bacilli bacterium]|jgi:large subunit ribosomal protein L15|nr:50S ribosomal protein L15 [Bacilli bacterium]MDD2681627.1 50S ribosomal protein L15 [Bacilli bacterium]MDD3120978.1 50S ribosomal protein L15 [Bacilli bacterium]MDD4063152.1 50S ribosomal protein L15 [Bacilli bacterium]MDD4481792.1 50S ribosomal protein L15 [Bacilli bacterium]